jgi:hypothetical protein
MQTFGEQEDVRQTLRQLADDVPRTPLDELIARHEDHDVVGSLAKKRHLSVRQIATIYLCARGASDASMSPHGMRVASTVSGLRMSIIVLRRARAHLRRRPGDPTERLTPAASAPSDNLCTRTLFSCGKLDLMPVSA